MKRILNKLIALFILATLSITPVGAQDTVKITLANSTPAEQHAKAQLERLMKSYDLSKWIATRSIVIDEKTGIPHSHPVLTLNTRHNKDDELLVSTFVHEQMHWFVIQDQRDLGAAIEELKKMFPGAPAGPPEGARDLNSTYLHIAVCYLEYRALRELMGELRAKQVIEFWTTDHYRWIYRTVLERPRDIGQIMFKHKLVPLETKAPAK